MQAGSVESVVMIATILMNLWEVLPAPLRGLILLVLVGIFVIIPIVLLLERLWPGITDRKFGPEIPEPGRRLELFSLVTEVLVSFGLAGFAAYVLIFGNVREDAVILLGAIILVFGLNAIFKARAFWRLLRSPDNEQHLES